MESDVERIERQQAEVKMQLVSHAASDAEWPTNLTLTIKDPTHLKEILEYVWIKSFDYGEMSQDGPIQIDVMAYGKCDITTDDLEDLI
jgi:hypothetical protein